MVRLRPLNKPDEMSAAKQPVDYALEYASLGWPVFPCHAATKQPLVNSAIEGEGGVKLATTDQARIRDWWKRWPLSSST